MKQVQSKMITVDSRGFVMTSRGRVLAPIRTPYRENVDRIWSMITQDRADVTEHIGGRKIPLNALNFDTDHSVEEQKEATPVAPETNPDGGVKVVNDIKTQNNEVHMRTGDVFSTDLSKVQSHHNPAPEHVEMQSVEQTPEEKSVVTEEQKEATPVAPETNPNQPDQNTSEKKGVNPSNQGNNQQGYKNNNQNNGKHGKNKHDKNKGNNNQSHNTQKNDGKKEDASDVPVNGAQKSEEKAAEPTTGSDLAVIPESV